MTHYGATIVLALSLKEFGEAGLLGQQIMKLCFQQAVERRKTAGNPVFPFADEGHLFVNPYEEFQPGFARWIEATPPKGLEILAKTWIPTFTHCPAHFSRFRLGKPLK
jgi:hypothetical protein